MGHLAHQAVTDAPLERVFDYMADSSNVPEWFYGVQRFEPLTDLKRGLGSRYAISVNVGRTLTAKFECTEFIENELIAVQTFDGLHASSRWTFEPDGAGTSIRGEFDYTLPGGPAGVALSTLIKPVVGIAIKQTTANLLKYAGR